MELVCVLEKDENVHPMLSTLFMEKGMQAVDELFTKNHVSPLYICMYSGRSCYIIVHIRCVESIVWEPG